ncbi:MAG: HelD family protein [Candidatus Nanopelagicales bacterium]
MPADPRTDALATEQLAVDVLYDRLDELLARAARDLERAKRAQTTGTPASRVERDAHIARLTDRVGSFTAAATRLVFGRLDFTDPRAGEIRIGRLSLSDASQRPLLSDWRATAAEPFYRATGADPMGVLRRRHITLEGRRVASVEDDILDAQAAGDTRFEGGGALLAALVAKRTGRMSDIVATIQAEQDRVIRSPLPGVLVVAGGPGCGKTVVGLHRAAYLLYTYRDQIARSGVLVVGPNQLFLRYISQVLPGLGESSAVLVTPGELYPGLQAEPEADDAVAVVKGDLRMAEVISAAVKERQRVPSGPRVLDVIGTRITLTPAMVNSARDRARASRRPHNQARRVFALSLLDRLVTALASARGLDPESNRDILLGDLRDSKDVRREVNLAWMPVSPEKLLRDLWATPELLAKVAPGLTPSERALLRRERALLFTISDVPLLDEAAELLGEEDEIARAAAAAAAVERAQEAEYARGVLEMADISMRAQADDEGWMELSADQLMDSYSGGGRVRRSVAESALSDRTWVFGHVVVDEAQELSPMAWRLLVRRCPAKSMTVVGDLAQASSASAPTSWEAVFDRLAPGRWSQVRLSVNYRTPAPVMELAAAVAQAAGVAADIPRAARDGEHPLILAAADLAAEVISQVKLAISDPTVGNLAVIATPDTAQTLARKLGAALTRAQLGHGPDALDAKVVVLTPTQAKGLEFDVVVVAEPGEIAGEPGASRVAVHDLYVALTRPTRRLVVVHAGDLPPGFPG